MSNNIILKNWNPKGIYEYGFGIGYYFAGERRIMKNGKMIIKPHNPAKQIRIFEELLEFMVDTSKDNGGDLPFFVLDDCSPVKPNPDRVVDIIGKEPLLYVHLTKNVGSGGKDNIIQKVLGDRCKYVLRFDSDICLDKLNLSELSNAFEKYKNAWAITSCITYFARMTASTLPDNQRYFASSNIADFVAFRSSIFEDSGYSDPKCRRNHDGDQRLRMEATKGMKCYVDREITGKATPSGSGNTTKSSIKAARYVEITRPFIRVSYPKSGHPRFSLNKKKLHTAKNFYIEPMPFAEKLSKAVWDDE